MSSRTDQLLEESSKVVEDLKRLLGPEKKMSDSLETPEEESPDSQVGETTEVFKRLLSFEENCQRHTATSLLNCESLRRIRSLDEKLVKISAEVTQLEKQLKESMQRSAEDYQEMCTLLALEEDNDVEKSAENKKRIQTEFLAKESVIREEHRKKMAAIEKHWLECTAEIERRRSHVFCEVKLSQQEKRFKQKFEKIDAEIAATLSKSRKLRKMRKDLKKKASALRQQLRIHKLREQRVKSSAAREEGSEKLYDDEMSFLAQCSSEHRSQKIDESSNESGVKRRKLFIQTDDTIPHVDEVATKTSSLMSITTKSQKPQNGDAYFMRLQELVERHGKSKKDGQSQQSEEIGESQESPSNFQS